MRNDRPHVPEGYGIKPVDQGRLIDWPSIVSQLKSARNYWIVTASQTGNPHAAPVWGVWDQDRFYFGTDPQSRKGHNLLVNHRAVVHLESGDQVVIVEGTASMLPTGSLPERADAAYVAKYGLHMKDGPVFQIKPSIVLAWSEEDYPESATRWHLE